MRISITYEGFRPIRITRYSSSVAIRILKHFIIHITGLSRAEFDDYGQRIYRDKMGEVIKRNESIHIPFTRGDR